MFSEAYNVCGKLYMFVFSLCILIFLNHILVSLSLQRIFFVLGAKFVLAILYYCRYI